MSALSATSAASTAALASGALSVGGLISGFDTEKIIEGLLTIEQQRLRIIDQRRSRVVSEQTAFKAIEARLLALQTQMTQLSRTQNGLFDARNATSSNDDAVSAAASSSAVAGVYPLQVNSLARAHMIASQGFDSAFSAVTEGSLLLKIGDVTTNITIDASNASVQGLATAINNSGAAVTASVVNDGGGEGRQAYRLVLTAKSTGSANRITITNNLAATGGGATKPIFDAGSIGNALTTSTNTSTSAATSNSGTGYTGATNNSYRLTVVSGGTVGTDDGITLSYSDATGANTGTITIDQADVDTFKTVAQGVQVQFAAGTLVAGDTFDVKVFAPLLQDAADASVTLGAGSGALTVTSAKNQFDSLIPGVAVQVKQADPAKEITLTIANDTEKMKEGIEEFVSAYNDVMTFIDEQTRYDSQTQQAGILLGNRQALTIQDQVRAVVTHAVDGANPLLNHIGALGITTNDKGLLIINDAKLTEVLSGARNGITLGDVHKLFALAGSSPSTGVQFVTGSVKTRASTTPYTVNITQAAEKATLLADTALAATTVIGAGNNTLVVKIDGATSATLTLANGSYSQSALAQTVQSAINGDTTLAGRRVTVDVAGGMLRIVSGRYGSVSQVTIDSGTSLASLGLTAGASAQGRDVVGSFTVDGVTETARGNGQFLVGDSANANTADLQLRVTLTAAQVGTGLPTTVSITRGLASKLDGVLNSMLDSVNGRLSIADDAFDDRIEQLDEQKSRVSEIMESRRQSLLKQFAAMERTLSQLQGMGNFLSTQAASLQR